MDLLTLLQGNNLMLMGGTLAVVSTLRNMFPGFFASHWGERLLPLLPLVIAVIGALCGVSDAETLSQKVTMGLFAGFTAGQLFKIGKTTVMAYGVTPKAEVQLPRAVAEERPSDKAQD